MTLNEYQQAAARTMNQKLTRPETELHALFGIASEVGELQGIYQKAYQGHSLDMKQAQTEIGDIFWYVCEYCSVHGWTLEEIALMNIDKLKARYPDGFDPERSLHRQADDT